MRGTLPEGQLLVEAGKRDEVTLILDGADISNGDLRIEGGEVVVDGPSRSDNGAID